MGNNLGGSNKAKVMRTNGETFKFKTPIKALDIMKCYPGHVLIESEAVKQMGLRAMPLSSQEGLKRDRIYFLIEKAMFSKRKALRRAQSDINTSLKDRIGCLTLQRSHSDMSAIPNRLNGSGPSSGPVRVKVKLPKAHLTRLMEESNDEVEVARKIIELYVEKTIEDDEVTGEGIESMLLHYQVGSW